MKLPKYLLIGILLLSPWMVYSATCSSDGYTIATINGVFTDKKGAISNMDALKEKFGVNYNAQKIRYEYLLNPTHLGGLGDVATAIKQKAFENEAVGGYDLTEMIRSASEKVETQKLLLVAHSQGNFYANSFHDVVMGEGWGVDPKSIAIYSVANPASRVAGKGDWITSDTDKVIAWVVASVPFKNIMAPNTHIALQKGDDFAGHGFSEAYLKYKSKEIVNGIKSSLDKLASDPWRSEDVQCITTPKLTLAHKTSAIVLAVADPVVKVSIATVVVVGKIAVFPTVMFAKGLYFVASTTLHAGFFVAKTILETGVYVVGSAIDITPVVLGEVRDAVTGLFSGNPGPSGSNTASVIGALQNPLPPSHVAPPSVPLPPPASQIEITPSNNLQPSFGQAPPPPQVPIVPTGAFQAPQTSSRLATAGAQVGASPQPMSFGGGTTQQEAPQNPPATSTEPTESSTATSTEQSVVLDGIVSATTSASIYTINPVTFSGEYHNSTSTFDTINIELKNTTLDTATTSITFSAVATTTGAILTFTKEVEVTDSGLFQYRARLENSGTASSTSWSTPDFFTVNIATTTATSTPPAPTTFAMVFETPNPANIIYSDLNQNGIADSEEENVVASSSAWLVAGEYVFNNLIITNNAIITAAGNENSPNTFKGVKIFAKNLTVEKGSSISANGRGGGAGVGASSAMNPLDLGGAGGGGAIRIVVTDTLSLDGSITANGDRICSTGGTINVDTNKFSGDGFFSSTGADTIWPDGVGGIGGRIAIHYAQSLFSGSASAIGGRGSWGRGGEGTIGFFDITNNDAYLKNTFRFQKNDEPLNFHNIYISNGAWVGVDEGVSLTAENIIVDTGAHLSIEKNTTINSQTILVSGASFLSIASGVTLNVPVVTIAGKSNLSLQSEDPFVLNSLILKDEATLTSGIKKTLFLNVVNLEVITGSSISSWTDFTGYDEDVFFASGVGASVFIKSSGKLILDGSVSANGPAGKIGGSVYAEANELEGSGYFTSGAGSMVWCGYYCGFIIPSGGRVAVYYNSSSFTGTSTAPGACGSLDGWSSTCAGSGKVVIDNISNKIVIPPPTPIILSSEKVITDFSLQVATSTVQGIIDEAAHTISLSVPFGTDVTALVPEMIVSALATSSPASEVAQDFTNTVEYTVTAEDGSVQVYVVSVTVAPDPAPIIVPDTTSPSILSYTFNGVAGDITADFATTTKSVELVLTASENVDWVTITIENQSDSNISKLFHGSATSAVCANGTTTCVKIWDGAIPSGGPAAPDGTYRIKAHIKDAAGNKFDDYLTPHNIILSRPE